jgi:vacuolar-type H+-ATPase subunit H
VVATSAPSLGSIEALKRVKATETDWELKLRAARGAVDEALGRLQAESEAAIKAAQASAEAERTRAVQAARTEADREAEGILAEGTRAAEAAARGSGKRPADQKDALLTTVLAGFVPD